MRYKIINISVRIVGLILKLGLALYIGINFELAEVGTYGLIVSSAAIGMNLIGMKIEHYVSREIVDASNDQKILLIRDEIVVYLITSLILGLALIPGYWLAPDYIAILSFVYILSILEGVSGALNHNLICDYRPVFAGLLFFVRSSLWIVFVLLLCSIDPQFRTVETIVAAWSVGVAISVMGAFYAWRRLPWRKLVFEKIDTAGLVAHIKSTFPIWLSVIFAVGAVNANRYVVEFFVGRESVGIISFFGSFTTAVIAVIGSGVFAFVSPRLKRHFKNGDHDLLKSEAVKAAFQAAIIVIVLSLCIGIFIPLLAKHYERNELYQAAPLLWWMLLGAGIRQLSEIFQHVMYARYQDKGIVISNVVYLIASVLTCVFLVKIFGLIGAGYALVLSSIIYFFARLYYVRKKYDPMT